MENVVLSPELTFLKIKKPEKWGLIVFFKGYSERGKTRSQPHTKSASSKVLALCHHSWWNTKTVSVTHEVLFFRCEETP